MSKGAWRALAATAVTVLSALTGIAVNMLTNSPSWTWMGAVIVLILGTGLTQLCLSLTENRSTPRSRRGGSGSARFESHVHGPGLVVQGGDVYLGSGARLTAPLVLAAIGPLVIALGFVAIAAQNRGGRVPSEVTATQGDLSTVVATASRSSVPAQVDLLTTTVTGVDNLCHIVAFPRGATEATRFLKQTTYPADEDTFMLDELEAGAYAVGDIVLRFNTQTSLEQQVTIYDVRAVDVNAGPPVQGPLINLASCGGEPTNRMVIPLNKADRGPFEVDEYDHETNKHFFDSQVINVAPGKKQSLVVQIKVARDQKGGSYVFRVAVDYEVDGKKYTKIVDNDGEPLRVSAAACPYEAVRTTRVPDGPIEELDPKDHAAGFCVS